MHYLSCPSPPNTKVPKWGKACSVWDSYTPGWVLTLLRLICPVIGGDKVLEERSHSHIKVLERQKGLYKESFSD